ncbi:hypothetical protein X797_006317 [Metarhizium robertsii]|uniref:Uncharacterized protein n=1 Tax=Metarhizium robertsii TaxID=568076 RepID=A0A014R071_9HYPO|nr:hypothetical protein X797_006317 [Metarhizium robertsii]
MMLTIREFKVLTSATTISPEALTVTDQPPSTSDKYTTLTYASTVTRSAGTKSGSASGSASESTLLSTESDSWVRSSALGVTGASTSSSSTEWEHSSSTEDGATNSESVTSPSSLSSHTSAVTATLTSDTAIKTNTLISNAEGTSSSLGTATVTQKVTVTNSVVSSAASFESSNLPITATLSSTNENSATPETSYSIATVTQIVTSTQSGNINASWGVSTSSWNSLSKGTLLPSISLITTTIIVSSQETVTTVLESASFGSTPAEETHTNSHRASSGSVSSSIASTTETDSVPRTKSYFSSTWANSTTGSSTVVSSSVAIQGSSLPGSVSSRPGSVSLVTGITTATVFLSVTIPRPTETSLFSHGGSIVTISRGSPSPPFPVPSNSTISLNRSSGSAWMSSSVLGTVVSPTRSQQSTKVSGETSSWATKTITLKSTLPPFQNTTSTSSNISHHSPWSTTVGQTRTITSIAWSSLPSHPIKHNSTDSNSIPTSRPRITSSRTRFTYQPSSILLSTNPGSNVTTKTLPPFPIPSNSTSLEQTLHSNTIHSTSLIYSSALASSSGFHRISSTNTMNATSTRTLTRKLTSTIRVLPNSTATVSQSEQSSSMRATTIRGSGSSGTSVFTGTSSSLSTLTGPLVTSSGGSSSTSTPRWTNSTTGLPAPTSSGDPDATTAESSFKQITVTTESTVLSWSRTQGVNLTTNRLTDSVFISSQSETLSPSEITLWPTNTSSFTGTESGQPEVPSVVKSTTLYPNTTETEIVPSATYTDHSGIEVTTVTLVPICTDTMVNGSSSLDVSSMSASCATFDNGTATVTRCLSLPNSNDPGITSLSNIISSKGLIIQFSPQTETSLTDR